MQKANAAAFVSVIVHQLLQQLFHGGTIHFQRHTDAVHVDGLTRGKENAFNGRFNFFHIFCIHLGISLKRQIIRQIFFLLHGTVRL